jgi:hypothetical protein
MAEHGVLELELGQITASSERSNQPSEQEVQEGSQGPRMLPPSARHAEPGSGAPQSS